MTNNNTLREWEKEAKELADRLEVFTGVRRCHLCGNEPEKQIKKISQLLKQNEK